MEEGTPSVGGYEWGITCECGQKIGMAGMGDYPQIPFSEHPCPDRTHHIDGEKTIECPNCERNITVSVSVE